MFLMFLIFLIFIHPFIFVSFYRWIKDERNSRIFYLQIYFSGGKSVSDTGPGIPL